MTASYVVNEKARIEDIYVIGDRRPVNEGAVNTLVASIERMGLKTPITIRPDPDLVNPATGEDIGGYELVAGRHRLEACRRLGWVYIPAIEIDRGADRIDIEMWEIAENLHRADLTALERDEQVARWIALSDCPRVSAQIAPKLGRPESGVNAAARELGIERTDAQRAKKVANLSDEAKAAAVETGLDNSREVLLGAAKAQKSGGSDVAFILQKHANQEGSKLRKEQDRAIAIVEAGYWADWIMARVDLTELPTIISWIEGTKAKDVTAALRRLAA